MKHSIIFLLSLLLFNCIGKETKSIQVQKNDRMKMSNEDFNKFYEQFTNDSLFQISRVIFPIRGVIISPPDINDTLLSDTNITFTRKIWRHLKDIKIDSSQFDKKFNKKNDSIIDVIIEAKYFDNYDQRTFIRKKGKWYLLTFYSRWT
jgi:hypothetical protein